MRVTVDSRDPDYIGRENFGRYVVLLKGSPLPDVIEADDCLGEATVFWRDFAGSFVIDSDEVLTRNVEGDLQIVDTWY